MYGNFSDSAILWPMNSNLSLQFSDIFFGSLFWRCNYRWLNTEMCTRYDDNIIIYCSIKTQNISILWYRLAINLMINATWPHAMRLFLLLSQFTKGKLLHNAHVWTCISMLVGWYRMGVIVFDCIGIWEMNFMNEMAVLTYTHTHTHRMAKSSVDQWSSMKARGKWDFHHHHLPLLPQYALCGALQYKQYRKFWQRIVLRWHFYLTPTQMNRTLRRLNDK